MHLEHVIGFMIIEPVPQLAGAPAAQEPHVLALEFEAEQLKEYVQLALALQEVWSM